jgi:hypothetical protein
MTYITYFFRGDEDDACVISRRGSLWRGVCGVSCVRRLANF